MNNIKSFSEFTGQELETIVYENELNEGLRKYLNKKAGIWAKAELKEEIEMSKTIMEGINTGLESLNSDFDVLRKEFNKEDSDKKNDKQKTLDSIVKLIEDSRKNSWDLNELIDEGEIDYTGFTANVGIASVTYFGILFSPFRSVIMIHKGYNYFFNIVKNTIRKALVMLQLNFDQFENLIITKGFQSLDYLQDQDTSVKISEFYGKLQAKLFDEKTGMMKGKRGSEFAKQQMQLAKNQIDAMMKADKSRKLSDNAYNCLDQYNNTYTRSLETLRQYTQDDVQKELDSIKTSINKLAGQDVDLQAYGELLIAAAEEHAYKVSSSIYNKFAKMTEVFSLPNQKKLIDLIQASTKEQMDAAEKESSEKKEAANLKEKEEMVNKRESKGLEVFKSIDGVEIGERDEETNKYSDIKASNWTYDEFMDKSDEDKESLEVWLNSHPEVLKECDTTLQIYVNTPYNDSSYIDSLIDYIGACLLPLDESNSAYILNFDEYINEGTEYELSEKDADELYKKFDDLESPKSFEKVLNIIFDDDIKDFESIELTDEIEARYKYIMSICEKDGRKKLLDRLKAFKNGIERKNKLNINFGNLDEHQINDLKKLYKDKNVAIVALKAIGEKVLKDKTFVKNSENIVNKIRKCFKEEKVGISFMTYVLLAKCNDKLSDLRKHDYANIDDDSTNSEKKSEE